MRKLAVLILTGLIVVPSLLQGSYAADLKWKQTYYSHYADGETLEEVLQDLMYSEKIPVMVSKKIDTNVNLHLEAMPPAEAFDRLSKTYQFIWYYDNQALFVYDVKELMSATLKLDHISSGQFTDIVKEMGIYDQKYGWEYANDRDVIYFTGPPRLVNLVMEMSEVYDIEKSVISSEIVYRWKDENGVPNFSTRPPKDPSISYSMRDANEQ
ncbi:MAG: DUF4124 domain-containing protein [Gammaproteobacteria bacterium]